VRRLHPSGSREAGLLHSLLLLLSSEEKVMQILC
jgi:hypothetical protein